MKIVERVKALLGRDAVLEDTGAPDGLPRVAPASRKLSRIYSSVHCAAGLPSISTTTSPCLIPASAAGPPFTVL